MYKSAVWSEECNENVSTHHGHNTNNSQVKVCASIAGRWSHLLQICGRTSGLQHPYWDYCQGLVYHWGLRKASFPRPESTSWAVESSLPDLICRPKRLRQFADYTSPQTLLNSSHSPVLAKCLVGSFGICTYSCIVKLQAEKDKPFKFGRLNETDIEAPDTTQNRVLSLPILSIPKPYVEYMLRATLVRNDAAVSHCRRSPKDLQRPRDPGRDRWARPKQAYDPRQRECLAVLTDVLLLKPYL